jgi:outer membrane protein OmpA-like peptidoglycan-associated protein
MNRNAFAVAAVVGMGLAAGTTYVVKGEERAAGVRLRTGASEPKVVVTADDAEEKYCTKEFKDVLARVIHACGLSGADGRRGCQPADVKSLASISDEEFNELFTPLEKRAAVIMFDDGSDKLDDAAKKALDERWSERKGARYFFVVARASKTGPADPNENAKFNRALSQKRANSVMFYLADKYKDPEIDKKVGLLWLGKEFAQLDKEYCKWPVTRAKKCDAEGINRSAFVSWVDCRL